MVDILSHTVRYKNFISSITYQHGSSDSINEDSIHDLRTSWVSSWSLPLPPPCCFPTCNQSCRGIGVYQYYFYHWRFRFIIEILCISHLPDAHVIVFSKVVSLFSINPPLFSLSYPDRVQFFWCLNKYSVFIRRKTESCDTTRKQENRKIGLDLIFSRSRTAPNRAGDGQHLILAGLISVALPCPALQVNKLIQWV